MSIRSQRQCCNIRLLGFLVNLCFSRGIDLEDAPTISGSNNHGSVRRRLDGPNIFRRTLLKLLRLSVLNSEDSAIRRTTGEDRALRRYGCRECLWLLRAPE